MIDVKGFFDKVRKDVASAQQRINAQRYENFKASQEIQAPTTEGQQSQGQTANPTALLPAVEPPSQAEIEQYKQNIKDLQVETLQANQIMDQSFSRVADNLKTGLNVELAALKQRQKALADGAAILQEVLSKPFDDFFQTIARGGKDAFKAFTDGLKDVIKQLAIAAAKAVLFGAITALITGGPFLQIAKGLFSGFGGFAIPKLASGGIVTKSTFANIGEDGAEAIIPLDRASDFMSPQTLELRVEGTDLVALMRNSEGAYNRTFG